MRGRAVLGPGRYPHLQSFEEASTSDFPLPSTGRGLRVRGGETPRFTARGKRNHVPTPHPGPLPVEGRGSITPQGVFQLPGIPLRRKKDVGNDKAVSPPHIGGGDATQPHHGTPSGRAFQSRRGEDTATYLGRGWFHSVE